MVLKRTWFFKNNKPQKGDAVDILRDQKEVYLRREYLNINRKAEYETRICS